MKDKIKEIAQESCQTKLKAFDDNLQVIEEAINVLIEAFGSGKKLLLCGNGGSAADSQHIAAEFTGRFMKERKAVPAIALTTDTSALTAIGNDYAYENVFSRQAEALVQEGDVLIGISTSGNSANVLKAVEKAKELGAKTITLTGNDGGKLRQAADININVQSGFTARIQESHITILHTICEFVENGLFQ